MARSPILYDPNDDIWPDLKQGRVSLRPVRVGMDRKTGKMLVGWAHVEQSLWLIFVTRFHERVIRRWVGSFVPHILTRSGVERTITRFYWAIITAIDLWEPNYSVQRVRLEQRQDGTSLTSIEEFRLGHFTTINEGVHRPRGHLGDFTAETRRSIGLVNGEAIWRTPA